MHSSVHYEKPKGKGSTLFLRKRSGRAASSLCDHVGYLPYVAFQPRNSVYY
jgi:hypothetical protein